MKRFVIRVARLLRYTVQHLLLPLVGLIATCSYQKNQHQQRQLEILNHVHDNFRKLIEGYDSEENSQLKKIHLAVQTKLVLRLAMESPYPELACDVSKYFITKDQARNAIQDVARSLQQAWGCRQSENKKNNGGHNPFIKFLRGITNRAQDWIRGWNTSNNCAALAKIVEETCKNCLPESQLAIIPVIPEVSIDQKKMQELEKTLDAEGIHVNIIPANHKEFFQESALPRPVGGNLLPEGVVLLHPSGDKIKTIYNRATDSQTLELIKKLENSRGLTEALTKLRGNSQK